MYAPRLFFLIAGVNAERRRSRGSREDVGKQKKASNSFVSFSFESFESIFYGDLAITDTSQRGHFRPDWISKSGQVS